ncbi:MAG: 2-C-methyl-D-erythritol 4-phosphate cytidylyltransferase [Acidobacteriota bacterium]
MNTAIIVAAGRGKRFASDTPKQFVDLLGKSVIFHTIDRFDRCDAIDDIVVVLAQDRVEWFGAESAKYSIDKPLRIAVGGKTRVESVRNGFRTLGPSVDLVAVHDAARPLVTIAEISRTIEGARETGAACLVASVADTIKEIKNKKISRTIDRSSLRRALTPQVFRYEILREALENCDISENVTDECSLVEKAGREIAFIDGSSRNIKITVPDDLVIAEALLRVEGVV